MRSDLQTREQLPALPAQRVKQEPFSVLLSILLHLKPHRYTHVTKLLVFKNTHLLLLHTRPQMSPKDVGHEPPTAL